MMIWILWYKQLLNICKNIISQAINFGINLLINSKLLGNFNSFKQWLKLLTFNANHKN